MNQRASTGAAIAARINAPETVYVGACMALNDSAGRPITNTGLFLRAKIPGPRLDTSERPVR